MTDPNRPAVLGDYVETTKFKQLGRVNEVHYSCPEGRAWQQMQVRLDNIRPEQIGGERWVSVLVHGGGAVCVPISNVRHVEPFEFENPWAGMYFGEAAKVG